MSHTSDNSGVLITNDTLCRLFSLLSSSMAPNYQSALEGCVWRSLRSCTSAPVIGRFFTRTILLTLPLSAIPIPTYLAHSPNSILFARPNMIDQLKLRTFPRPRPLDQRLLAAGPHPTTGSSLFHLVRHFLGCYRRAPHAPHPFLLRSNCTLLLWPLCS